VVLADNDALPLVPVPYLGDGGDGGAGGAGAGAVAVDLEAGAGGLGVGAEGAPAVGGTPEVLGPDVATQVRLLESDLQHMESERDSALAANDVYRVRVATLEDSDALRAERVLALEVTNNALGASNLALGGVVASSEAQVREAVVAAAQLQQSLKAKADQEALRVHIEQESLRLQNQREAQDLAEQAGRQAAAQALGAEQAPVAREAPKVQFVDPPNHRSASPLPDVRGSVPGRLGQIQEDSATRAAVLASLQDQRDTESLPDPRDTASQVTSSLISWLIGFFLLWLLLRLLFLTG
jgi:hypothetical protein